MEEGMTVSSTGFGDFEPDAISIDPQNKSRNRNRPQSSQFLQSFVETCARVADAVVQIANDNDDHRVLKSYASILKQTWPASEPLSIMNLLIDPPNLQAAVFTVYSFLMLVEARDASSRIQKIRCEDALELVARFMGDEKLLTIEQSAETKLAARRIAAPNQVLSENAQVQRIWDLFGQFLFPNSNRQSILPNLPGEFDLFERNTNPNTDTQVDMCEVWFGTNRAVEQDQENSNTYFSNTPDPDSNAVHYGRCLVELPEDVEFGTQSSISFWPLNKDNSWTINGVENYTSADQFIQSLQNRLSGKEEGDRSILLYIHGYNTTFQEAALSAAKLGFFLNKNGVTAFYSWPSRAHPALYWPDREEVEASEKKIAEFITLLAGQVNAKKVNIIAHSMGNRGLLRAMQYLAANLSSQKLEFGQIILAAADLGPDLFKNLADQYSKSSIRTTLYASKEDKALFLAKKILDTERVGLNPPVTVVPGIDTLVLTKKIDPGFWKHGYIIDSRQVLNDMHELLISSRAPDERAALEPVKDNFGNYWRFF